MVRTYKRYDKYYGPSRTEWIKEIPVGWTQKRIGFELDLITGYAFQSEKFTYDDGIKLVRGDNVTEGYLRWGDKLRMWPELTDHLKQFLLSEGDVLIGMDGSKVGKNYALVKEEDLPLLLVQRVARLRSRKNLDPKFLFYCIGNVLFLFWVTITKTDPMVPHITPKDITDFEIPFPPIEEQRTIATFLDKRTRQIDNLIEQKEKLLTLLTEKRTAIITQAVTKGLDPKAKMKDSGIDWLGEVPEHWEVWKTTHGYLKIGSGSTPKSDNPEYYNGDIPWITTSELRENIITDTSNKLTEKALREVGLRMFSKGSVAIAMYGATIGRLGILGLDSTVNQACCVFDGPIKFYQKFLYYWLWMRRDILISLSSGGGQPNLSQDDLKKLRIPIPDISEQKTIAEHLDKKVSEVIEVEAKLSMSIYKLKEYRSSLITSAVTGQIDVRNEVGA